MSEPRRFRAEWLDYVARVMPPDVPAIQMQETRRAFYAGAQSLLALVMRDLEPDSEPTDADLAFMEALHQELQQFGRDVGTSREGR